MAHYFVGDIQGCFEELQLILAKVDFNPSKDELWAVGDLVARGNGSLQTLRYLKSLEASAKITLGNHDLHLLALNGNIKRPNPKDKLAELLSADDLPDLITWIRKQPLVQTLPSHNIIMSHAGIPPQWDLATLLTEANAVSQALQQDDYIDSLIAKMYTDDAERWDSTAIGLPRLRYCINALTRMRYLFADGSLDFKCKSPIQDKPPQLTPWFEFNSPLKQSHTLVFGHWAALMGVVNQPNMQALDTGCCWGEHLTLWHLETNEKIQQHKIKS
ncbi:symmetrical bis(5'-nucleosyl)-tetraphosphatase [Shewanella sp. 10N.286.52.B9]|uniref:symmetrical bis(5'-nucleosyl)-tetraphosphatase n=1 Tax=Shewanella sp. 10N.286.52.B9 TaxID=1880837 RepID=UPI000C843E95|nr:symmetrical bis(5'-nucleosyl)-tetraphosphatase [Shewanella sp. 10N.286.52.B9]PMG39452.1 bis(5'-nucleosyl)-tetraphosphatase (symmetrical) [Shewanella sp. 10N.286.52.B9]